MAHHGRYKAAEALGVLDAGSMLIWHVGDRAKALDMGRRADLHALGSWDWAMKGLGPAGYFDLSLTEPVDIVVLVLVFGRLPDQDY